MKFFKQLTSKMKSKFRQDTHSLFITNPFKCCTFFGVSQINDNLHFILYICASISKSLLESENIVK